MSLDERHYRVNELAKVWRVSRWTITRLFQDEPGVLRFGNENARVTGGRGRRRRFVRRRVTLSIPESVARRVQLRLTEPPPSRVG